MATIEVNSTNELRHVLNQLMDRTVDTCMKGEIAVHCGQCFPAGETLEDGTSNSGAVLVITVNVPTADMVAEIEVAASKAIHDVLSKYFDVKERSMLPISRLH